MNFCAGILSYLMIYGTNQHGIFSDVPSPKMSRQASRVITTTRIETVAIACCSYRNEYVYKMEPLDNQLSKRLFLKRIFGSEDAFPEQLREVSTGILGKCSGLPLAIVSISSLLANQATTAWRSSREEAGNPALMMSTPRRASWRAATSFSALLIVAPGDCSPSRSVVSKMCT